MTRLTLSPAKGLAAAGAVAMLFFLPFPTPATAEGGVAITPATLGGLSARAIGPAAMGGRIAAIDAVAQEPLLIYVGAASGGVWKSTDGGLVFRPVFDDHPQSIGAIEIDPNDPETVWVGTGETWTRNSVSVGRGLFKTTDGGENWREVGAEAGLSKSERIGAIRVDPSDSDVVYVCATGALWNASEERGVYKTTDGGETFEKVLFVDENTGCADLDIDPQEPSILYAALWQFRRYPDFFESGGPGSGLYKSTDGGTTWNELRDGLPEGELGRIAVAVAPSRPSTVYAVVESEDSALYRSDDLGQTWQRKNASPNVVMRPFYFSELEVDPQDHERVYKPGFTLTFSPDGGDSFSSMFGGGFSFANVHPDHHALWIHPEDPNHLLLGTDGGLYVSHDRAVHWRYARALPIAQFYHVSHDDAWPYNVYGGLQDNGSWMGPSRKTGGITNADWQVVGFGDGFWAFPDQEDPDILYVEYQGGQLMRLNEPLGEFKSIKPFPKEGEEKLRFNWNTPIRLSHHDAATLYYGSQYLHRSRDRGESWETISPDLTTDDPERQRQEKSGGLTIDNTTAENNATIYTIAESPHDPQVIWVGTDDGYVQLTRDGGESWQNVTVNVPGVPEGTWVSSVTVSPHQPATAFVTFDGHRTGDMAVYVFRTDDYGQSWRSIADEEIEGYAWVIKQDPVNPDLLFLGTEFGLYVTLDGGLHWARFEEDLPPVAVHDLVIHPTEHDVILATHGRGVYIIDDVSPLRALTPEILEQDVALLPSRPSPMIVTSQNFGFSGDEEFVGETPQEAATIDYYLKKRHLFGDLKIEIYAEDGELITTLPGSKRRGLNRVYWPMRLKPPKVSAATNLVPAFVGPRVLEGTYEVKLIKGKETVEGEVELVADPRTPHSEADRRAQQVLALDLYERLADLAYLTGTLSDLRDAAEDRAEKLSKREASKLEDFAARLEEIRGSLVSTSKSGMLSGDEKLREYLASLYGEVVSYDGRPTDSQLERAEDLKAQLAAAKERVETAFGELEEINKVLGKRDLEPLERQSRDAWEAEENRGAGLRMSRDEWKSWGPVMLGGVLGFF